VSKDLFEQQIGETLRKAESTPPAGAWEMIKSQIPASYTPPFTFPTWAVIAVSVILLGGMAMSDNGQEDLASVNTDVNLIIEEEGNNQDSEARVITFEKELPAPQNNLVVEAELENTTSAQVKVADAKEYEEEITDISKSESNLTNVEEKDVESAPDAQLPVQVEVAQPLTALVEQAETVQDEVDEFDVQTTSSTAKVESKLSVKGVNSCYTPCELTLSAEGNAAAYSWDAEKFGLIQGKTLNVTIDEPQTLTVYVIGEYEDGTVRSLPRTIEVMAGSELFVPNSFTPNGDGVNDAYLVGGNGIESFSMTIINSKGKVVFQTSNMNETWNFDGSTNELENEVYTAIIRATGIDGKVHAENQRLTILP